MARRQRAVAAAIAQAVADAPGQDADPHDAAHGNDCGACRLASGLAGVLPVPVLLPAAAAALEPLARATPAASWADAVARWHQRRKHGPPSLPR